jgi:3-phenylpropionate/trans-cinnamate dioxygenase ferredoxin subunit
MPDEHVWHRACAADEVEEEDVAEVTVDGKPYAVYRIAAGYFATDGLCTHEQAPLADGFVSGDTVECAKHNARFHIPSGKALRKPALRDLCTYPIRREGDELFIGLPLKDP